MTRPQDIPVVQAPMSEVLEAIVFHLGFDASFMPVYVDTRPTPREWIKGTPMEMAAKLHQRSQHLDFDRSREVSIGIPQAKRAETDGGQYTALWCWLKTKDSAARAARWRYPPTFVLRIGAAANRLAVWALRNPEPGILIESANKKLAYFLRGPQKYALPSALRVPVPGTFIRIGRVTPAPVLVTRLSLRNYTRSELTGRLRDPPRPYMERLRAGEVTK